MAFEGNHAEAHNSRAGRTARAEKVLCCVTTRPRTMPFRPTYHRHPEAAGSGPDFVAAGHAPPPRASAAPQTPPDVPAAASFLASDAPAAGIPGLGSTAGSIAGPDTSAHTPCGGNSASPAAGPWRARLLHRYAATVPREVTTPLGPPGEDVLILLGHSPIGVSPLLRSSLRTIPSPRSSWSKKRRTTREVDPMLATPGEHVKPREGNREGDVPEMLWA